MDERNLLSLSPLSGTDPAGEDLEYDELYLKLDELASGVPSQEMAGSVHEGREPDYAALRECCLKLWERTRDLRVAAYYALAELRLDGLPGFKAGLEALYFLVDAMYASCYPKLDPDDDNDPTERINIFQLLSPPPVSMSDGANCLSLLRRLPLCSRLAYTFRDYLRVCGMLDSKDNALDSALFQAELHQISGTELTQKQQLAAEILQLCDNLIERFNQQAEGGVLTLDTLQRELKLLQGFYAKQLQLRGGENEGAQDSDPGAQDAPAAAGAGAEPAAWMASPAGAAAAVPFKAEVFKIEDLTIKNRSEALQLLDKCAAYFKQAEPNSPLPFLIKRALRMADMNFIELLGEIDSSAAERGREQLGVRDDGQD
ncbi:MAG: type VI secretion system protein TssA [Proteobacteria bacterium]|uniref:Type VI secretion system protein TssA n=1 Tax=Candidatus Avisuccinivibrio stercorigallinarum TaxID=2840704 RepID=A0A9D9D9Q3_9GAMM|nr:type VI secretion system protein TssA [Candidatus Avisuccinivibrio stercorigallinarum]